MGQLDIKTEDFGVEVPANSEAQDGVFTNDVVIDSAEKIVARVFTPVQETGKKKAIVIFYHGGGFVSFSPRTILYDSLARRIAKLADVVVVSPDYRLAPDFPCPTAYDDSYKAFDWLRSPESKAHLPATADVSQIFLLGDSAGGNIAHFMAVAAAEKDISPLQIRGLVQLQPFFGGEELTPGELNSTSEALTLPMILEMWKVFLPGQNRDHPNCNVFGPNSRDISKVSWPPVLVVTGSNDILQDRIISYIQKLQEIGRNITALNYDQGDHGFFATLDGDPGKQKYEAIDAVCEFIRSKVSQ